MAQQALVKTRGLVQKSTLTANSILQRGSNKRCKMNKTALQRSAAGPSAETVPPIVNEVLRSPGRPLDPATREFMEPRFGHDFSRVRVHTDAKAARSASAVNSRAYTIGMNIVFGEGQYQPKIDVGKRLLAHELTHVMQQRHALVSNAPIVAGDPMDSAFESEADLAAERVSKDALRSVHISPHVTSLQREAIGGGGTAAAPARRLDYRPSIRGSPCACLVFIHNNEHNAHMAAENLHSHCRYNLAIIEPGTGRRIPVPGRSGDIDPNELFPQSIQEECTRDEPGCRAYVERENNLRSMQIQFFLAIKDCSDNFTLPTVALHNNDVRETASFRRAIPGMGHRIATLMEDINRGTERGRGSREDLRHRLESVSEGTGQDFRELITRRGSTNIFRWCNLPEISRCHIGDPFRPDHVIWATNVQDYNRLRQENVNVVLQEGPGTTVGTESETDLSTLFMRLGPDVRFLNIETPISPEDDETRLSNMMFILQNLTHAGLNCCLLPPSSAQPSVDISEAEWFQSRFSNVPSVRRRDR